MLWIIVGIVGLFIFFYLLISDWKEGKKLQKKIYLSRKWFPIGIDLDGNIWAIELYSLLEQSRLGSRIRRVWVRTIFSEKYKKRILARISRPEELEKVHSVVEIYEVDCKNKIINDIFAPVSYDKEGNALEPVSFDERKRIPIALEPEEVKLMASDPTDRKVLELMIILTACLPHDTLKEFRDNLNKRDKKK